MFNFLFNKNVRIKSLIYPIDPDSNKIESISSDIQEKEIVLFLLLIFARIYKNSTLLNSRNKNDLNLLIIEIDLISTKLPKEVSRFQYLTSNIKRMFMAIGNKNVKPTPISLLKWKDSYTLYFGKIYDGSIPPYLHLFSSILLFSEMIKNKDIFLDCLIKLSYLLNNNKISMMEAVRIPHSIINEYYN